MASKMGDPDLRKRMLFAGTVKSPRRSSRMPSTRTHPSRRLMVLGIWMKRIARLINVFDQAPRLGAEVEFFEGSPKVLPKSSPPAREQ